MYCTIDILYYFINLKIDWILFFFLENGQKVREKEKNSKGIYKNVIWMYKKPQKAEEKNHKQIWKEVKYKKTNC